MAGLLVGDRGRSSDIMAGMFSRSSGVLIHVSSLPGPHGIGDLGPSSTRWIDWLADTGTSFWQTLPLGPPGFGNSPYSSPSSRAGNIDLISPEMLHESGLIAPPQPIAGEGNVDYGLVRQAKHRWIDEASHSRTPAVNVAFSEFREKETDWLDDYSLFMALKERHNGAPWTDWDPESRRRDEETLAAAARALADEMERHAFGQFLFYQQLEQLRSHATDKGIEIIGDVPLYVASDSVDVWMRPDLFAIDHITGEPELIAGVPPDSFSPVGQVWGTPTYRWEAHVSERFEWWVDRVRSCLRQSDVLRIDHFTGFCRYYAVEAGDPDPLSGSWHEGPGIALFEVLRDRLGDLPIVVEDLGPLGDEVERLRSELGYPGMRVLQEAFAPDPGPTRTPELYPEQCVVYTGTHDNDTARGRFESEDEAYRRRALAYTGGSAETFASDLVARAWETTPVIAIAPMQDLLGVGTEHRMNRPGTIHGNWEWRMPAAGLNHELQERLGELNRSSGRLG